MTSIPASRSARAMIFAPRSCPSRPGLATTTRIFFVEVGAAMRSILWRYRVTRSFIAMSGWWIEQTMVYVPVRVTRLLKVPELL